MTLYDEMGGRESFEKIVSHFYALVAVDPVLRPMYPDDDFKGAAERLLMFLEHIGVGPQLIVSNVVIQGYECAMPDFISVRWNVMSGLDI